MIPGVVSGQAVAAEPGEVDTSGGYSGDSNFANVVLLAVWDGLDSDSNFDDVSNSNHMLTAVGDAQTDTDFKILSEPTLYLDGNGDYVTVPDSDDFYLPGAFTIEFWARPDVSSVAAPKTRW